MTSGQQVMMCSPSGYNYCIHVIVVIQLMMYVHLVNIHVSCFRTVTSHVENYKHRVLYINTPVLHKTSNPTTEN